MEGNRTTVDVIDSEIKQICESIINGNNSDNIKLFEAFGIENDNYNNLLKKLAEKENIEGEEAYKFKLPRDIRCKMFLYCYEQLKEAKTPINLDESIILLAELSGFDNGVSTGKKSSNPKMICKKLSEHIKKLKGNNLISYLNSFYYNEAKNYGKEVIEILGKIYRPLLMRDCRNPKKEKMLFFQIPEDIMKNHIIPHLKLNAINDICNCYDWRSSKYKEDIEKRYLRIYYSRKEYKKSTYENFDEIPEEIKEIIITNFVNDFVNETDLFDKESIKKIIDNNFMNTFICLNAPKILDKYFLLQPLNKHENIDFPNRLQNCMFELCQQLPQMKIADKNSLRSEGGIGWEYSRYPSNEALRKLFEMMKAREYFIKGYTSGLDEGLDKGLYEKLESFENYLGMNPKEKRNRFIKFANAYRNDRTRTINGNMIC